MNSLWLILFIPLGISALRGLVLRAKTYEEVSDKWGTKKITIKLLKSTY